MTKKSTKPTVSKIKKVGIIIKANIPEANTLALEAALFLKSQKIAVSFATESKDLCAVLSGTKCESKEVLTQTCDLLCVFGGDGTFISIGRYMIGRSIPILGFNMGHLGFLTEFKKSEMHEALTAAIRGELEVSERKMLECTLQRGKKVIVSTPVVNDVVISKGEIARIFDIEVNVDGKSVTKIRGDGLVIATPTGSTAYLLAAGGPIVEPTVPAIAIAAICPHSVTLRPLVIHDRSKVTLIPLFKGGKVILTLDGQSSFDLELGDLVRVTRYEANSLLILKSPKRDYYSLLREKLKYGYRD